MMNVVVFLLPVSEVVAFVYASLWVSRECIPNIYFICSLSPPCARDKIYGLRRCGYRQVSLQSELSIHSITRIDLRLRCVGDSSHLRRLLL